MVIKKSIEVFQFCYKGSYFWEFIPPLQAPDFLLKAYTLPVDNLYSFQDWGPLFLVEGMTF